MKYKTLTTPLPEALVDWLHAVAASIDCDPAAIVGPALTKTLSAIEVAGSAESGAVPQRPYAARVEYLDTEPVPFTEMSGEDLLEVAGVYRSWAELFRLHAEHLEDFVDTMFGDSPEGDDGGTLWPPSGPHLVH